MGDTIKLMFRTVVNSFFLEGQMDGRTDLTSDNIRYFYRREKNVKNLH